MNETLPEVYLARHGETAWTVSRRHTGRTDLPLTARGEDNARGLHDRLRGLVFDRVFVSPLRRARQTGLLAGFGEQAVDVPDLTEWDYGAYEGLTTAEIRGQRPGWSLFRDGCPGGESVAAVGDRADRVIARLRPMPGRTLTWRTRVGPPAIARSRNTPEASGAPGPLWWTNPDPWGTESTWSGGAGPGQPGGSARHDPAIDDPVPSERGAS